ncbi:MAG TPA: GNAT family N-acetyltransferase [Verrucomicrobiae bacterium]|nr:GNAT family N-acetyltransferase [Verrucomicrobiae bacterium]
MKASARAVSLEAILSWRDMYRLEMNCQVIHDSIHSRVGWTVEYLLKLGDSTAGYGSLAVAGPWKAKPTIFEFYVMPQFRARVFDLFSVLLSESGAKAIEVQSNDVLITVMLHTFAQNILAESILYEDRFTTSHAPHDAAFRKRSSDAADPSYQLDNDAKYVIEFEGKIVAAGDILFHYNRPYGDIYMKVAELFRRRGFGSYLVQELKRVCYEGGSVPAARCNATNTASRKTLQKAGFVPCGNILVGSL